MRCILAMALALAACGNDIEDRHRREERESDDTLKEFAARQEALARAKAEAERRLVEADGKHWYDLPKTELGPGLHDCERYLAAMRSYVNCSNLSDSLRDSFRQSVDAMKDGWSSVTGDSARYANDACRSAVDNLIDSALLNNCTLTIPP